MRIVSLRPESPGGSALARFDIELNAEIKLLHWSLKVSAGAYRVYPPQVRGAATSAFLAPALIAEVTKMATDKYQSRGGSFARIDLSAS